MCKEWMLITNAKTLLQHNFLLESLQFLYQENDQS